MTKKMIKCKQCGIEFKPRRKTTKFCSNVCSGASRLKRTILKCDCCGVEFERNNCHISTNNFCSNKCHGKWMVENRRRENGANWQGGIYNPYGKYIFLYQEDGSYKQEHRIVVENEIGRLLNSDEIIHHIDGDGTNNDISNLEIMNRSSHAKLHAEQRR